MNEIFLVGGIGLVMWFLIIKPQMDEKREHDELVASLAKDDRVVTRSGLHARVVQVQEETVVLEIADKTRVTCDKSSVARRLEGKK